VKLLASLFILVSTVANADIKPIEPVLVPISSKTNNIDIYMGKYEVTVAEFTKFVKATGHHIPKNCLHFSSTSWPSPDNLGSWDAPELIKEPHRPVVCVGTKGAMAYAKWVSEATGKTYRLPERHEWIYAASGGKNSRFPFGEDYSQKQICDYENIEDFASIAGIKRDHNWRYKYSASCSDGAVYHTVVGMYRPNNFGLHDMIGNVKELMMTCHKREESDQTNCIQYSVAGESWHWQARDRDTADWVAHDFQGSMEGFRLVLDSNELQITSSTN
jgi:formylglycine-generating enzyme required for sulfatase activity